MNKPTLEKFLKDVASHQITVNLDNGVFRDITVKNPNTSAMQYNITTRPNYLIFTGDMGEFVFKRINDMFRFFRNEDGSYDINASCFIEEREVCSKQWSKEYSKEKAIEYVHDVFREFAEGVDTGNHCSDVEQLNRAEFECETLLDHTDNEKEFFKRIGNYDSRDLLVFENWWEYDFNDYSQHFIWACYAVIHAIKLYDEYKEQEKVK